MKTIRHSRGFGLIELMIAVTISLILLAGVMSIMLSSKRTYNLQSDLARLQENARLATEFIANDLRMAGYVGCSAQAGLGWPPSLLGVDNEKIAAASAVNDYLKTVSSDVLFVSFLDTSSGAFSYVHCGRDVDRNGVLDDESDLIDDADAAIKDCQTDPSQPDYPTPTPLTNDRKTAVKNGEINPGDFVVVSDCSGPKRIRVASVNNGIVTFADILGDGTGARDYSNQGGSYGAELRRQVVHRYFVGRNNRGGVSLFRDRPGPANGNYTGFEQATLAGIALPDTSVADDNLPAGVEEVVEGVENLQVRYLEGFDTNSDGEYDQYQYVAAPADWHNVIGVRITLAVRTLTDRLNQDTDTGTYVLDPGFVLDQPEDHRQRGVFTTTILLRNTV